MAWGYGYAKRLSQLPFLETLLATEKAERLNVRESPYKWRNPGVKKSIEISQSESGWTWVIGWIQFVHD
jgi:hypothetical protein